MFDENFNWDIDFSDLESDTDDLNDMSDEELGYDENVLEIDKNEEKKKSLIDTIEKKSLQIEHNNKLREMKSNENTTLTEQQLNAITMYMEGMNKTQIAKAIGVTRQTVIKWFKKDDVKAEIQEREEEIKYTVYHELYNYVPKSVKIIKDIIEDDTIGAKERLRGIQMLWDATGFSKTSGDNSRKTTTVININPDYFPNNTVVNNNLMQERVIEEDIEDTTKVKEEEQKIIDIEIN